MAVAFIFSRFFSAHRFGMGRVSGLNFYFPLLAPSSLVLSARRCGLVHPSWCNSNPSVITRSNKEENFSRESRARRRMRKMVAGGTVLLFVLWLSLSVVPWSAVTMEELTLPEPIRSKGTPCSIPYDWPMCICRPCLESVTSWTSCRTGAHVGIGGTK